MLVSVDPGVIPWKKYWNEVVIWFHPLQGFLIIAFLEEDYGIEETRTIMDRFGELCLLSWLYKNTQIHCQVQILLM